MEIKKSVISNFFWRLGERIGAEVVAFIVSIVLARLLAPSAYGTLAIISVILSIMEVFINCGLTGALIQKKEVDDVDFSSTFYIQMAVCVLVYIIVYIISPYIALFYNNKSLTSMIRVMGLTLIIAGLKNIQSAYVMRNLMFKKFFFSTLIGTIASAIIGIILAVQGYGVWALIIQGLLNNTIDTIILWGTVGWRPKLLFNMRRVTKLLNYSWKLFASNIIDTIYNNIRTLIIGKVYTSESLAYYNRGNAWPNLIVSNVNASLDSVLFPSMAKVQDEKEHLKLVTRRTIKTCTYIMAPMLMGIAFVAEPLVKFVLTEKWLPSVYFMRVFCIIYMFYPIHTANLNAIKALGRSDVFLKLEIQKKAVGIIAVLISMNISVKAMALSMIFVSFASQIINSKPNKKLLGYGYLEQLKDILPGIMLAVFMGFCIYPITLLGLSDIATLCIMIPLGAIIYISLSAILKLDSFMYLWNMVKLLLKNSQNS